MKFGKLSDKKKRIQEKLSQENDTCTEIGRMTMTYPGTKRRTSKLVYANVLHKLLMTSTGVARVCIHWFYS